MRGEDRRVTWPKHNSAAKLQSFWILLSTKIQQSNWCAGLQFLPAGLSLILTGLLFRQRPHGHGLYSHGRVAAAMELLTEGMKPPLLFICQLGAGVKRLPALLASDAFSFLPDTPKTPGHSQACQHSSGSADAGDDSLLSLHPIPGSIKKKFAFPFPHKWVQQ